MKLDTKINKNKTKEDHYDIELKTYKETINITLEKSELRQLIGTLDNFI